LNCIVGNWLLRRLWLVNYVFQKLTKILIYFIAIVLHLKDNQ